MTWLSVKDAAPRLDLSEGAVYRLCETGALSHRRIGPNRGKIRISDAAIEAYLAGSEVTETNAPAAKVVKGREPARRSSRSGLRPDGRPYKFLT